MCGIVGLHLKQRELRPRLGELLTPMLDCMASRGPDSAGIALYGEAPADGSLRYSVRTADRDDHPGYWDRLAGQLSSDLGAPVTAERRGPAAAVLTSAASQGEFLRCLRQAAPGAVVAGYGHTMEIYKDIGAPADVCARYGIPERAGYQGIGHTRMATESAVTTSHSHPFAPAADLALVHNGSFSNYATVRRRLARAGVSCETDNDSEVAARYIAWQMSQGRDLTDALRMVLKEMDGFFTLLVTTGSQFAVVRDSFACKPLVVAETGRYVAVASEYHAMAGLPGITSAEVFEPMPEEIHAWSR
jgi:methylamine---glutamate N-methyltransferase subunit A